MWCLTHIRPWTRVMPVPLRLRQVPSECPRLEFLFHLIWFCTGFPSSTAFSGGSWGKFDLSNPASPASSEWEYKLLLSPSVMSDSLQPHGQQHARLCILHYLPECVQTQVHWVGDTIQPSHPLLPPFLSDLNLSQHQGLFQWVSSSLQVARVLELQHQSFQWIFRVDFL